MSIAVNFVFILGENKMSAESIILFAMNEGVESVIAPHGLPLRKRQEWKKQKFKKDRRRRRFDRRRSVREGVIVSLSSISNRRQAGDRRRVSVR